MGLFNKLFGKKEDNLEKPKEQPQPKVQSAPTSNLTQDQEGRIRTLKSIYPYFKQFKPSSGHSIDLPADLSKVDKTKVYNVQLKPVIKNICADLNCLYAIDNEYGYEIIQESKLTELQITEDQLHEIALANFRELLSTNLKSRGDKNGVIFIVNGNLEAGLVLIDEVWDQLENQIGEEIIVAVPSRDVIIATGKSNRTMIESFNPKAIQILEGGDHPLSKNWFLRKNNRWEVFEPIIK